MGKYICGNKIHTVLMECTFSTICVYDIKQWHTWDECLL